MANGEYQQYFGHINPEEMTGIADRWFNMPTYTKLPAEEIRRIRSLTKLKGNVKEFVERTTTSANELAKAGREFDAIDFIDQRFAEARSVFNDGDDLLTARRYTFYRMGDYMRTTCFLSAARDYMLADLELGYVTDYGFRVSECFGGARNGNLQMAALGKCFDGLDNVILVHRENPDMVIVKDLERRSKTIKIAEVPGGGSARIIHGEYPDPKLN